MDKKTEYVIGFCFYWACVGFIRLLWFMLCGLVVHMALRWLGWSFYPFF